ncbi:MAG: 2-hydroxyacid dehydrogenase [Acidobacteriota bacterium]
MAFDSSDQDLAHALYSHVMTKVHVKVTRKLFPEAETILRRAFRITRLAARTEGMLVQLTDRIDEALLARMPRLRVISQCAVGVDNIDLRAAARRGITVMNTPGVLTEATADLTWGLILSVARRIPEADRLCRSGRYRGWDLAFLLGQELHGRTLGIIGPGRIGSAVARRALGFGMKVLYHRHRKKARAPIAGMHRATLRRLLVESDVVSLHVPGTRGTHHLLGRREMAWMKPSAILINTSRGTAVDEKALITILKRRHIKGAGLDVFENEPRIPAELKRMPHVVLTPHIASATRDTRGAMALLAARNLVDFFEGKADRRYIVRP